MASIYKRARDRKKRNAIWLIDYTDHEGRRRTAQGFSDKSETQQLAAQLERDARLIRQGLKSPDEDRLKAHRLRPIDEHVGEFDAFLKGRDVTIKQRQESINRLNRIVEICKFRTVDDIATEKVTGYLSELRDLGRSKQTGL